MITSRRSLVFFGLVMAVAHGPAALADNDHDADDKGQDDEGQGSNDDQRPDEHGHTGREADKNDHDHDEESAVVREAVKRGNAHHLRDILQTVRDQYPGEVLHVGVSGPTDRLIYNIRVLDQNNQVIDLRVDAKTRTITPEVHN